MKYVRPILILVLAAVSVSVSADKKKKNVWPTDSAYIAHRRATIMAMDSVLKLSGLSPDPLMRFADHKCAEFNHDPELMRAIASGFVFHAGYIKEGFQRYQDIKKRYPKDFESYSGYAAALFDKSVTVNPNSGLTRDPDMFNLAKAQIDSAKTAFPNDIRPYTWWIARCTFYAYNDSMQVFINDEVEALRKKFPNNNADYEAAKILGNKDAYPLNMANFEHSYIDDGEGGYVDKWFFQAEARRDSLAQHYYDKADINTLSEDVLTIVSNYYYESTQTKNITRAGRAALYRKGLERAALGMKKFPDNDNFKYLQLWNAAELASYHYRVANSDSVKKMGEERKWDELDLSSSYATQALQAYENLNKPADSIDYKAVMYAAMATQYQGKHEDAIQLYQQALNKRPPYYDTKFHNLDSLTAYQNMASCYNTLEHYEDAIAQTNAMFELRKSHGGQLKRTDLLDIIKLYRSLSSDTTKTQQERFAAYVSIDSLYATIQDSIDAGNELYTIAEGRTGYYQIQRLIIRGRMNTLSEYRDRENYLQLEIAEDLIRRLEPLENKSDNEKGWLSSGYDVMWRYYYRLEPRDAKNALKYIRLAIQYDKEKADTYEPVVKLLVTQARRQR